MNAQRKAVVVGGASGIGAAVAARLARRGDEVWILDRTTPAAPGAAFVECDLREPQSIDAALSSLPGGLAAVAYVAGVPGTRPAADVLAVNFLGMRHFLRRVVDRVSDGGALAVVASTAGTAWSSRRAELEPLLATATVEEGLTWLAANPSDHPIYSTTKEAAILFAKRWSATLWAERGIRINTVSPGPVETPILGEFEESMGKAVLDGVRELVGRHATTDDIAPVIEAVLGSGFGWVTGQDVQVDAGSTTAFVSGAVSPTAL
jgi:NAD(P)-dependent dehydrogenase (short-subunit alcohol dehydrogenase family)